MCCTRPTAGRVRLRCPGRRRRVDSRKWWRQGCPPRSPAGWASRRCCPERVAELQRAEAVARDIDGAGRGGVAGRTAVEACPFSLETERVAEETATEGWCGATVAPSNPATITRTNCAMVASTERRSAQAEEAQDGNDDDDGADDVDDVVHGGSLRWTMAEQRGDAVEVSAACSRGRYKWGWRCGDWAWRWRRC